VLLLLLGLYFLPAFIAGNVKHRQGGAIFALNLLLGWTLIGWVVALVWALTKERPIEVLSVQNTEAGLRPCPHCAELIQPAAKLCRYCGHDVLIPE
jgi:hypothetical protein